MCLLEEGSAQVPACSCFSVSTRKVRFTGQEAIVYKDMGEEKMRRNITSALIGVVLLFGNATSSSAAVKRVEMHIGGYLCGN